MPVLTITLKHSLPYKSASVSPYRFLTPSIGYSYKSLCILFIPQLAMLALTQSYKSLCVILVATLASILARLVSLYAKGTLTMLWASIAQGLTVGFLFPEDYPILSVFFIVLLTFGVSIYVFKDFSSTWVNIACLAVVIGYLCAPALFSSYASIEAEGEGLVSDKLAKDILAYVSSSTTLGDSGIDASITDFLNMHFFRFLGVNVPRGYMALLWDNGASIAAFKFNAITLLSSIILLCLDVVKPLIPAIFLLVYLIMVRFLTPVVSSGYGGLGDMLLCLFTGGTLFYALYLVSWYATYPMSLLGRAVYAIVLGLMAFLIAGPIPKCIGLAFAIMASNVVALFIERVESLRVLREYSKDIQRRLGIV